MGFWVPSLCEVTRHSYKTNVGHRGSNAWYLHQVGFFFKTVSWMLETGKLRTLQFWSMCHKRCIKYLTRLHTNMLVRSRFCRIRKYIQNMCADMVYINHLFALLIWYCTWYMVNLNAHGFYVGLSCWLPPKCDHGTELDCGVQIEWRSALILQRKYTDL